MPTDQTTKPKKTNELVVVLGTYLLLPYLLIFWGAMLIIVIQTYANNVYKEIEKELEGK